MLLFEITFYVCRLSIYNLCLFESNVSFSFVYRPSLFNTSKVFGNDILPKSGVQKIYLEISIMQYSTSKNCKLHQNSFYSTRTSSLQSNVWWSTHFLIESKNSSSSFEVRSQIFKVWNNFYHPSMTNRGKHLWKQ